MKKVLANVLVVACLLGSLTVATTVSAGAASPRVAKTSCTTMGLTPASLKSLFGTVTVKGAGYECGIVGDDVEVTLYLYTLGEKPSALKADGVFHHAKRLGGLGAGADFENDGGGYFRLNLTSGSHFVYILGQLLPSQGKLLALAHVIYRALA
jgi:hypothetical protein